MNLRGIGFIGIGRMGLPMAANLLAAGHRVQVWNRSPHKCAPLVNAGAVFFDSPAALASHSDVLITMLTDAHAVAHVLFEIGVASALPADATVIDMSSIAPDAAIEHARRLQTLGIAALDAPVSGGTKGAAAGTLAIMAGGHAEVFARMRPLLTSMGRPVHVGPNGMGQIAKLANQLIVAITLGGVAEALAFVQRAGADPKAVRDALAGGFADSRILQEHGERMLQGNFAPGGTITNQVKDLEAASAVARTLGLEAPLLHLMRRQFAQLIAQGDGDLDHSAIFKLASEGG